MRVKAGVVLYSGYADHIDDAKEFIARFNLSQDDVSMRKCEDGGLYIITKRSIDLCEKE